VAEALRPRTYVAWNTSTSYLGQTYHDAASWKEWRHMTTCKWRGL